MMETEYPGILGQLIIKLWKTILNGMESFKSVFTTVISSTTVSGLYLSLPGALQPESVYREMYSYSYG